ncbi:MAG: hypothetical protein IMF19_07280 [Proteobacteria bacterium]|jgi:hypothetical protein|nr:hypothetical protein [Pseudomonadota bacterium]
MTPIEIMAFIAAIIVPIKIIMLLRSQKSWFNTVTRRFWGNAVVTTILSLIVVIVTLYYLLQELTIIQIWAVTLFTMALIVLGLAPLSKYMLNVEKKWFTETNVLKTGWVAAIVWLVLIIWVLYALFT